MDLRVKTICKEQGITITELAARLGMKQVSLSRIVHGDPKLSTLQKIADALSVPLVELFEAKGGDGSQPVLSMPIPITVPDTQMPNIGILEYLKSCIAERKAAREVVQARFCGSLYNHLEKYRGEVSMKSVTTDYINGFKKYMNDICLCETTQFNYVQRLKTILAEAPLKPQ